MLLLPVGLIMCGLRFRSTELAGQRRAEMHSDSYIWMGNFQIAVLLTQQLLDSDTPIYGCREWK